ncbi:MAG: hypothetical protein ACRDL3_08765 [Solirubrobacterales bacterium]
MTRTTLLSLAAVSLLGAGLIVGCGGGGGDEDPQEVLDETFTNDETVNSGVLDLALNASAEGEEGGSFDASLSGPFQGAEDEFPELDLTASLSGEGGGQSIDFEGGLITTADAAFVSYQGTTYEIPQQFYDQLKSLSEQAQEQAGTEDEQDPGAVFEQLGLNPSEWLTEPENEGDEDVEGTETVHIHADANVPQILEDLQSASERTGAGEAIDPDEIAEVEEAIDEASIDVYSGKDDRILRRLDLNLAITPPEDDESGVDSVDLEFSLTLSEVNEEQTIEAPSDAESFDRLESDLGLPPGLLEGALGGGIGGGSLGGGALGGGSLGGGGDGGGAGAIEGAEGTGSQKYLNCISQATTAEELQACNP